MIHHQSQTSFEHEHFRVIVGAACYTTEEARVTQKWQGDCWEECRENVDCWGDCWEQCRFSASPKKAVSQHWAKLSYLQLFFLLHTVEVSCLKSVFGA